MSTVCYIIGSETIINVRRREIKKRRSRRIIEDLKMNRLQKKIDPFFRTTRVIFYDLPNPNSHQVLDVMKSSLISILKESVVAYKTTHRKDWVLDWPGQVVLAGSQIYWTTEVEEVGVSWNSTGVGFTLHFFFSVGFRKPN